MRTLRVTSASAAISSPLIGSTPTPGVATALSVPERTIVLCHERMVFDTEDKPIEMMTAYYNLKDEYCRLLMR